MAKFTKKQKKELEAVGKILGKIKKGEKVRIAAFGKNIAISYIKRGKVKGAEKMICTVRSHKRSM